jgi:membrane-anchored protein YejM (alkaline phosphatase superfamily)
MNRRKFAHSWGRKLFFGVSWPLTLMIGLLYFRSYIFPTTLTDWVYFLSTYIGHFGLLNAVVYFVLFAPLVALTPSYYLTRIWALLLILALNILILIDAISFSSYHLHIYSYLSEFFILEGGKYLVSSEVGRVVIYVALAILSLFIWLRGEFIWRAMQTRFSNPIKNYYLVIILSLVVVGKLIYHYGDVQPKLASVFPLDFNFMTKEASLGQQNQKFFYPSDKLNCRAKHNPNIVIFLVREWHSGKFSEESMPQVYAMKKHAINYTSHMNVNTDVAGGTFSLFYSLPATYQSSAKNTKPVFLSEIEKRNYEIVNIDSFERFTNWIDNRSGDETRPFYLLINLDYPVADEKIQNVIGSLQKEDLLKQTHLLFTGVSSTPGTLPLMYAPPARNEETVSELTTHYDVLPTLMAKLWDCQNVFKVASVGKPLGKIQSDWLIVSGNDQFVIHDLKNDGTIEVKDGVVKTSGSPRERLIFPALKRLNRFNRP